MNKYTIGTHYNPKLLKMFVLWARQQLINEDIQVDEQSVVWFSEDDYLIDTLVCWFTGFVGGWEAK